MNSKTSFFNKSLFKSDMKRFWWVGLLETFAIFIACVFPYYERCFSKYPAYARSLNSQWGDMVAVILLIFAVGVSVLMFSYLHFSNSVSVLHSMPVKRKCLFLTKIASGLLLVIAPLLINTVILFAMKLLPEINSVLKAFDICQWLFTGIIYSVVMFSLCTAVNMMTGNPIGAIVFTGGFAVLPAAVVSLFESFFNTVLYGCSASFESSVLPYIYITSENLVHARYFAIYLVMTAVFFIGAYALYKFRKLEAYGEVIAFDWLKPVFIGIVAVLSSMLGYFYITSIVPSKNVLLLIPFGIIGTVISWMVAKKSINPRGVQKPLIYYLAAVLIFIGGIHFDLTGFERRVPSADAVASARIVSSNENERTFYHSSKSMSSKNKEIYNPDFTEKADIENVIAMHKYCIENRFEESGTSIPVKYKLKNGKTLQRMYFIDFTRDASVLKPLYETIQIKASRFPILDETEKTYKSIMIQDDRLPNSTFTTVYPDNALMTRLIEAMKKDLLQVAYEEFAEREATPTSLIIEYSKPQIYEDGTPVPETEIDYADSEPYYVRESYTNTIAILKEMGFYDKLPTDEDIASVDLYAWNSSNYKDSETKLASITDSGEIAGLYNEYPDLFKGYYGEYDESKIIRVVYNLNAGNSFEILKQFANEDEIPAAIKKYIK